MVRPWTLPMLGVGGFWEELSVTFLEALSSPAHAQFLPLERASGGLW